MFSRDEIQEKNLGGQNLGKTSQNWARNQVFRHFLEFGSLAFLEIAYNDSLQQCITSRRDKNYEKNLRDSNLDQNRPKIRFFAIFLSLLDQFSFKLDRMIAYTNVQLLLVVEFTKKIWESKFWSNGSKSGPKFGLLSFSKVWFISFPGNCIG